MRVIIAGAGLAGLTYVRVLRERGAWVAVSEASDDVGGHMRIFGDRDGSVLCGEKVAREVLG